MSERSALPTSPLSQPALACVGPPALVKGEDAAGYDELLARISGTLRPADILEEIWVRDVVDLVWEIFRLRRLKAQLMQEAAYEGMEKVLSPRNSLFFPQTSVGAYEMARRWATGDRKASEIVGRVLASSDVTMDAVWARTLTERIEDFERIDRMTMMAEGRRDAILRELGQRRACFAQRLRRAVRSAEDAEFRVVGAEEAAHEGAS